MIKKQISMLLVLSLVVSTRAAVQKKPFGHLTLDKRTDTNVLPIAPTSKRTSHKQRTSHKKKPQKIHNLPSELGLLAGYHHIGLGYGHLKSYGYLYNIEEITAEKKTIQFPLPFDNGGPVDGIDPIPVMHNMVFDQETNTVTLANKGTYLFIFSVGSANGYNGNKIMTFDLRIYDPVIDFWKDYPSRAAYTVPSYDNPGLITTGYAIAQNVVAGSSVGIVSYWSYVQEDNGGTGTLNAGTDAGPNVSLLIVQIG